MNKNIRYTKLLGFTAIYNNVPIHITGTLLLGWENCPTNLIYLLDSITYTSLSPAQDNAGTLLFTADSKVYYTAVGVPYADMENLTRTKMLYLGRVSLSDYCKVDQETTGTFYVDTSVLAAFEGVQRKEVETYCGTPVFTAKIVDLPRSRESAIIDYEGHLVMELYKTGTMGKLKELFEKRAVSNALFLAAVKKAHNID